MRQLQGFCKKFVLIVSLLLLMNGFALAQALQVQKITPSPFFLRAEENQPLRQKVRLYLQNSGKESLNVAAKIQIGGGNSYTQTLGVIEAGQSTHWIDITDIDQPSDVSLLLHDSDRGEELARYKTVWQPQKKWRIYSVSYCHHDHGYGGYPHRLRTEVRHENIIGPIRYCRETADWDEDSRFRYVVESSEPVTTFLSFFGQEDREALAALIREGRIQIGGLHSTVQTEMVGHELMARLFYLSNRHLPDLLNIPAPKTALNNDVIGITWPFATFAAESGLPYFFHGHNACGFSMQPAQKETVFYWQSPDGQSRILTKSDHYVGNFYDKESEIEKLIDSLGSDYPYDAVMIQNASDFKLITLEPSERARKWNAKYAYPRLIVSTFDMYFDAIAAQMKETEVRVFAKDANNQWADEEASQSLNLGMARRLGEELPSIEKFYSVSQALFGGGVFWTDFYEAYHYLLTFHEHTAGRTSSYLTPRADVMKHYETELEENREMVDVTRAITDRLKSEVLGRFADAISLKAANSIVVFNPLGRSRSDTVYLTSEQVVKSHKIRDIQTGRIVPLQVLGDGSGLFVAELVPPLGYRTYEWIGDKVQPSHAVSATEPFSLENRYYRVVFNRETGSIKSIYDKQLQKDIVDHSAPHDFNEYLYERIEKEGDVNPKSNWYRVTRADSIQHEQGPVADRMIIRARAGGVEWLEQTITLYHSLKRIDFVLQMMKSPSGREVKKQHEKTDMRGTNLHKEAVYVALPFAVEDYRFYHGLPGAVVDPIHDQFEGAATAHYGIRHFSDVSGPSYGVTVSAVESGLIQYGFARSEPLLKSRRTDESDFESDLTYPKRSHMYLYLMNNMFSTNIALDQQGLAWFTWSIRSHEGDWQTSKADQFGWDTMNPLLVTTVKGPQKGTLPAVCSLMEIDQANVECLTIKPSEFNGRGYVLRFHETQGRSTDVSVSLAFLKNIQSACRTSLIENDYGSPIEVLNGDRLRFSIKPFGIETIRLIGPRENTIAVQGISAEPYSDMQIKLSWKVNTDAADKLSHYHIYRDAKPDFQPTLLNLVQRSSGTVVIDQPRLHYAGWISNRLEPDTVYYYRMAAVDRWNNEGPVSNAIRVSTLSSESNNMVPLAVEGLRVVLVSPISDFNFVNLIWRTACESDIAAYEVYRCTGSEFDTDSAERIAIVRSDEQPERGEDGHARVKKHYVNKEYDHLMRADKTVQPGTIYTYRVRALDAAGQSGPFSNSVSIRTKQE